MRSRQIFLVVFLLTILGSFWIQAQDVEVADGVRLIHNKGKGIWAKAPRIGLEKLRELGDIEAASEEVAFYMPLDMALDAQGNLHVLDTGNHRIQKFSPDGTYLATIGQQGQGPGEFNYPGSLDIDSEGNLIVASHFIQKIQILDPQGVELDSMVLTEHFSLCLRAQGMDRFLTAVERRPPMTEEEEKAYQGPEPLMQVMDRQGKILSTFGEPRDYNHEFVNATGNIVNFAVDREGHVYLAYRHQNRVEKYSPQGELLWRADRKLNYNARKPITKGTIERSGGGISMHSPRMNRCSETIAVDDRGRVWVVTYDRQFKEEEEAGTSTRMSNRDGQSTISMSPWSEHEIPPTSDAFVLEVFDAEGVLLQRFPLNHYADVSRIGGDRLYILDKVRRMQVHCYRIVE